MRGFYYDDACMGKRKALLVGRGGVDFELSELMLCLLIAVALSLGKSRSQPCLDCYVDLEFSAEHRSIESLE